MRSPRRPPWSLRPIQSQAQAWQTLSAGLFLATLAIRAGGVFAAEAEARTVLTPASSTLLDIAATRDGFVAVGLRGLVVTRSAGADWSQSPMPTRHALTAVAVTDAGSLVAVGHAHTIVVSADDGASWQVRYQEADQGPLLDVALMRSGRLVAVGAYGSVVLSDDGGSSWRSVPLVSAEGVDDAPESLPADNLSSGTGNGFAGFNFDELEAEDPDWSGDLHLNGATVLASGTVLVAAEAGVVFRSADQGETWQAIELDFGAGFPASMFAVVETSQSVYALGLKGRVFASQDDGLTWVARPGFGTESIVAATSLGDTVVMVGDAGQVTWFRPSVADVTLTNLPQRIALSAVASRDNEVVAVGESGVTALQLPEWAADSAQ